MPPKAPTGTLYATTAGEIMGCSYLRVQTEVLAGRLVRVDIPGFKLLVTEESVQRRARELRREPAAAV